MPDKLLVRQVQVGPMGNFAYIVACAETRQCVTIDAAWDVDSLLSIIEKEGMTLIAALVTHCHPDHVGGRFMGKMIEGTAKLLERVPVKAVVHEAEMYGFKKFTLLEDDRIQVIRDGDLFSIGNCKLKAIHTPGHSPGGVCWFGHGILISGDTLFLTNCGRVDLPGASADLMFHSLTQVLAKLPDDTVVYPGHAYDEASFATLGEIKRMNPYLSTSSRESWGRLD